MASFLRALHRCWCVVSPPVATKHEDALKFGMLGASNNAPMTFITPALTHPGIVIHAIAARDKKRAIAYAKKHSIPVVKDSYEAILDDPVIDVVYIPLPAGLHFEWAIKALAKGKHVLLEKPSASNGPDAETLFHLPLLSQPTGAPVLMEAFHVHFHPAWRLFLSLLDPPNVSHVLATATLPAFLLKDNDIRWDYNIGGGALLDLGTYPVAALRTAFAAEPTECVEAQLTTLPKPRDQVDHSYHVKFKFPNGGVGEVDGGLKGPNTSISLSTITVTHRPTTVTSAPEEIAAAASQPGTTTTRTRTVTFRNFLFAHFFHRVDVVDEFEVRDASSSAVVKKFTKKESKTAYTFRDMDSDQPGEPYWSTYRYMLEQFVDRIKGRKGTGVFVSHEESVAQAKALDMIYQKSGLSLRPQSEFRPETV